MFYIEDESKLNSYIKPSIAYKNLLIFHLIKMYLIILYYHFMSQQRRKYKDFEGLFHT